MKKFYTLIFLIALFFNSFSQTYYPLIRANATWDVMHRDNSICGYYGGGRFFFDGDTIINNFSYKIIKGNNIISINYPPYCPPFAVNTNFIAIVGFMREDTSSRKVFVYDQINNTDDLLYDFNLNQGDTLQSNYYAGLGMTLIVDSVSSISLLNGGVRKIIFLNSNEHYIESIGGSQGLFFPLVQGIGFSNEPLCVIDNGVTIYDWGISGGCLPIVGIEETFNKNRINIYPNPVLNNFDLSFPTHKEEGTLKIFNLLGNLVLEEKIPALTENKNIDISRINPGIYFCRVVWAGEILAAKIIKE